MTSIDVIAISHAHADHIGQLDRVLEALPVAEVWMSGTPHTTQTYDRAVTAIEASDATYEEPRAGERTDVGSLEVEILHPIDLTGGLHDDTLALRITFGEVRFLFTGDAECHTEAEMVERDPGALRAEVYQVGHHGSRTSSSPSFLDAVGPTIAIYSAAEGNSYGHPHPEVVHHLTGTGIDLYGTPQHGTVTVTTDGETWEVTTETNLSPVPPLSDDEAEAVATPVVDVCPAW